MEEPSTPLQENVAHATSPSKHSPSVSILARKNDWFAAVVDKKMQKRDGIGSQSLPSTPRLSESSIVELRHQWIEEELIMKKNSSSSSSAGEVGLSSSSSGSPRSHELVDQRHKWIQAEILSKQGTMKQASRRFDQGLYHIRKSFSAEDDRKDDLRQDG